MKLDGSPQLRLYNEKSDVIRPYYSLTHRSRSTSSTMYCVICNLNVSKHALRPTTIAKIRLQTDCCNAFPNFFKVWERKFHGAKVLGTFSCPRIRKFWTFCSTGANVLGNESFTGTKVLSDSLSKMLQMLWDIHNPCFISGALKLLSFCI